MTAVGDTIYIFDINYRVYPEGGGIGVGPIYAEHFRPWKITGENKKSWLLGEKRKVLKLDEDAGWFTEKGKTQAIWVNDNGQRIVARVQKLVNVKDYALLRRIAEVLDNDY